MDNTIIYTYKKLLHKVYSKETNQKEWIIKSIASAREVGYTNIELYTNDIEFTEGLDLNEIHLVDDESYVWDSLKVWVLANRKYDNYFLCDNDVIFKDKIPFESTIDIYFDGIENHNWKWVYAPTMKYLKSNNLFSQFDFLKYEKIDVYNVGILQINNLNLRKEYIYYWNELYKEIKPHLELIDKSFITPIITQYLLTILIQKGNYSHRHFTNGWPYGNDYYNHFPGFLKLKDSNII